MRRVQRFPEKFQRPLSDREKMLIKKVKEGVVNDKGVRVPNIKVLDDYKCPRRERRYVMDEVRRAQNHAEMQFFYTFVAFYQKVEGRKGQDRRSARMGSAYDPDAKPRPQYSYLDIVRCGGRTSRLAAKKKKEKPKKGYVSRLFFPVVHFCYIQIWRHLG